jgi:hypothetical protein
MLPDKFPANGQLEISIAAIAAKFIRNGTF